MGGDISEKWNLRYYFGDLNEEGYGRFRADSAVVPDDIAAEL
jgi:hypothetical protein